MKKHYKPFVRIKGSPLELNGENLVMAPLSLLHLEQFQEKFKSFNGDPTNAANVTFFIDAVHAALQRNYPRLTRDEVASGIGLEMMEAIMLKLVATSGLTHTAEADSEAEK